MRACSGHRALYSHGRQAVLSFLVRRQPSHTRTPISPAATPTRGSVACCSPASPLLTPCRAAHIGHNSDVHKWRSPEKEEVRRQFRSGVDLGSEFVKIRNQQEIEKRLIEEDKFTNWNVVYGFSLGTALLLIAMHLLMAFVEPVPSPEYVPYVKPAAPVSTVDGEAAGGSGGGKTMSTSHAS